MLEGSRTTVGHGERTSRKQVRPQVPGQGHHGFDTTSSFVAGRLNRLRGDLAGYLRMLRREKLTDAQIPMTTSQKTTYPSEYP